MVSTSNGSGHGSEVLTKGGHPRPATLAHVVLRTTPENYQPMIAFYKHLLNATIAHASPVITFLRFDEEHHRIAILQTPDVLPKPQGIREAGLDHIAFGYSSLTELARTYMSLKAPGSASPLQPLWCVNHGPTTSLYYRDPDFNKVELQVDNFDSAEDADSFMSGTFFEQNPIGTDFDPDTWADKILGKAETKWNEGLTEAEERAMKVRKEIGERANVPDFF